MYILCVCVCVCVWRKGGGKTVHEEHVPTRTCIWFLYMCTNYLHSILMGLLNTSHTHTHIHIHTHIQTVKVHSTHSLTSENSQNHSPAVHHKVIDGAWTAGRGRLTVTSLNQFQHLAV